MLRGQLLGVREVSGLVAKIGISRLKMKGYRIVNRGLDTGLAELLP